MVRKRLITVLTFNDGVLFRTKDFKPDYRYTLNFVDAWSVDEIVVLDVTPNGRGLRNKFVSVVERFSDSCFVPLAAGGGVRSTEDFSTLLHSGADKIVINSAAVDNPKLIEDAARQFGSQCVIVSIDAKLIGPGKYEMYTHNGTSPTGIDPVNWAVEVQRRGAGEILIGSIDRDGSLEGYDNILNAQIVSVVDIPVLIVGGAGKWQDFVNGFRETGASAVCTTCIYHFTETSIKSAKAYLNRHSVNVRD